MTGLKKQTTETQQTKSRLQYICDLKGINLKWCVSIKKNKMMGFKCYKIWNTTKY